MPSGRRNFTDLAWAWLAATLLSGLLSTAWALLTGGDVAEPTLAAGSMLLPNEVSTWKLFGAAALVHPAVSLFWALVLWFLLPRRRIVLYALLASVGIALIDLKVIAPLLFPRVAALDFWPQLADHLMWGASYGIALHWRRRL